MLDPSELYEIDENLPALDRPVLVHALSGFIDAGSAGQLVRDHLLGTLEHRVVARFDVDQLLDYRARRPPMVFVEDHWESYEDPTLALHVVYDAAGTPFLLLDGAEPDVQWERFITAVRQLVERLGVRLAVGLHGIPMGVPHTRPAGVTAHGTRAELIAGHKSVEQIRDLLGADSLGYVSLEGLTAATTLPASRLCRACFDGRYPIPVAESERGKHLLETG